MLKTQNREYVENFQEIIHDSIYRVLNFSNRNIETNVHVILCKYRNLRYPLNDLFLENCISIDLRNEIKNFIKSRIYQSILARF